MRICCKGLLPLLLSVVLPAAVEAQFNCATNNGMITITGYTGPGGDVAIPATINVGGVDMPVISIGDGAFSNCVSLTSVTLPHSITSIGANAFSWCNGLTKIAIGDSVTNIGDEAFFECGSLNNIAIPDSVTSLGYGTFLGCLGLASVTIGNGVASIPGYAFYSCWSLTNITIPQTVTSIGDFAFLGCFNLSGVYFQGNAPSLGSHVFSRGTGYYLPGTIGWAPLFGDLPTALWKPQMQTSGEGFGLRTNQFGFTVNWAKGMTFVVDARTNVVNSTWRPLQTNTLTSESYYFSDAQWTNYASRFYRIRPLLTPAQEYTYVTNNGTISITGYTGYGGEVTIPDTIDGLPVVSIADGAFDNSTSVNSVAIPNSVTNIGSSAFYACWYLTSVAIGDGVTSIGANAFGYCPRLAAITVAANNPMFSSLAGVLFSRSQTTLVQYPQGKPGTAYPVPDSVTDIADYAFLHCRGLTSITMTNSVLNIGFLSFADTSLSNVVIPSSVTTIKHGAFYHCDTLSAILVDTSNPFYSSLAGVLLNKSQTTLLRYPQAKPGSSYTFPSTVTNIDEEAFYGAPLTAVAIPDSIISLGSGAFDSCASLTNVTMGTNITSISDDAFYACGSLSSIMIPSSVTSIEAMAFSYCSSLTNILIPSSITNIGYQAFCECVGLTGVYFEGNAPSADPQAFYGATNATAYYLSGTTGWAAFSANTGVPAVLWNP